MMAPQTMIISGASDAVRAYVRVQATGWKCRALQPPATKVARQLSLISVEGPYWNRVSPFWNKDYHAASAASFHLHMGLNARVQRSKTVC